MSDKPNKNADVVAGRQALLDAWLRNPWPEFAEMAKENVGQHLIRYQEKLDEMARAAPQQRAAFTRSIIAQVNKQWVMPERSKSMSQHFVEVYGTPGGRRQHIGCDYESIEGRIIAGMDQWVGESLKITASEVYGWSGKKAEETMKRTMYDCSSYGDPNAKRDKERCEDCIDRFFCWQAREEKQKLDKTTGYSFGWLLKETSMGCRAVPKGEVDMAALTAEQAKEILKVHVNPLPKTMVIWEAKVMPTYNSYSPTEQHMRQAHTVVQVGKSRQWAPGTWLELTQIGRPYGFGKTPDTPPPAAPDLPSSLLERLGSAAGLDIDGYATWEGVIEFAIKELDHTRERNKELLLTVKRLELAYNEQLKRANQAADHAGNLEYRRQVIVQARRDDVANMTEEILLLKRQLKETAKKR